MVAGVRCEICKADTTFEPCGCTEQDHINKLKQELTDLKERYNILIVKHIDLKEERTELHKKIAAYKSRCWHELLREHGALIEKIRVAIKEE